MTSRPKLRKKKAVKTKRKMRPGGGKQKGNAFERVVCKELSVWVTKGQREDVFWRSAMSGGRATVRKKKGKDTAHQAGDICSVHALGSPFTDVFFVECKAYKDLKAAALLFSGSGTLATFWAICKKQAKQHGKLPMLILRQNQQPAIVGISDVGLLELDVGGDVSCFFPKLDLHMIPFVKLLGSEFPI